MKRKLLPIAALLVFGMVGCSGTDPVNPDNPSGDVTHSEPENAAVTISNKTVLQGAWYVGSSKTVSVDLTPSANAIKALKDGDLKITSSDPTAFDITGLGLNAKKAGTFTITATFFSKTDTVEVTIREVAPEPAKVTTTVSNLIDNWSTLVATEKGTLFEVEAYITGWQSGKTDGQKYGNFFIGDSVDATKTLYVYGCSTKMVIEWDGTVPAYKYTQSDAAKDWLTNDLTKNAVIGGKVKLQGIAYTYSTTKEFTCKLISYEAPPKVDPETLALSNREVTLEVGKKGSVKAELGPIGAVGNVTWTVADETIATVKDGEITAVKAGSTTVTVAISDFPSVPSVTCKINVVDVDNSFVVPETPVAGTAYKLGLAQYNKLFLNNDLYYFFNGKMNGNYVDTGDYASAVEVYVEAATDENTYNLYFLNAAKENEKTYIETYMNGTYVNCKLSTTAPAIAYKWDATNKVLACDINNGTYAIGTSNSGTYNTLGPRTVGNGSFFAQLYTVSESVQLKGLKTKVSGVEVGESKSLAVTPFPVAATLGELTYSVADDSVLTVSNSGVVTGVAAGTTAVTITSNDVNLTVNITVSVDPTNYGTAENPLTPEQALAVAAAQCKNAGDFTRKMVYCKGVLTAVEGYFNNGMTNQFVGKYTLNVGEKSIPVVNSKATGEGVQGSVAAGDEVIVKGYITKDATAGIEFLKNANNEYPEIIAFGTRGTGSIAVDNKSSEKATVTLPEVKSGTNGTDYSFTVTAADGFKVTAVKVGGVVVTADSEGKYNAKFHGDETIVVETADATSKTVTLKNSHDAVGTWTVTTEKEFTLNEISLKTVGLKTGSEADKAEKNYGYWMLNKGYIAAMSSFENVYISNVAITFTANTGTGGKIVIELSAAANAAITTATTPTAATTKGGSISVDNTDQTLKFFTISNFASSNAQIAEIVVTYLPVTAA